MAESALAGGGSSGEGAGAGTGGAGAAAGAGSGAGASSGAGSSGAGNTSSWRDSLPEDIRANPAISSFTDVASLAKSHIHAQSQIGKKGAIVPGEKATDEEWSSFYRSIGVPTADKYEVAVPKDVTLAPETAKAFKELMANNGVLPKAAEKTLGFYAEFLKSQNAAAETARKAAVEKDIGAIKAEWGDAFERNANAVLLLAKEQGGEDVVKILQSGVPIVPGAHPGFLKFLANAARLMGEDKLREGGAADGTMTGEELDTHLTELRGTLASMTKDDPRRPGVLAKFESAAKMKTRGK
jgi:hypothetical protein